MFGGMPGERRDDHGEDHGEDLATVFLDIARHLEAADGPRRTQERITRAAVATVPGCQTAAISLVRRRGPIHTVAPTDDLAPRVDEIQYDSGQGPCLDAIAHDVLYRTGDLTREGRWPDFAALAAERTGVRSMLTFRLFVQDDVLGALNMYSRRTDAFDDHAVAVGAILAGHAALAVTAARERERVENLTEALHSNRDIGVAIGILMAAGRLTRDEAFDLLRRTSQWLNVKLRDVAAEVAYTGQLPRLPQHAQSPHLQSHHAQRHNLQ
jgi:GAF domain-containing protein